METEDTWDWESAKKDVKKKILKKSWWDGTRPIEGSLCKIVISEVDGEWDSELELGKEVAFTVGYGNTKVEERLERCLLGMDKNEVSLLQLGDIKCTVELKDFTCPEVPEYLYDTEDAIKAAMIHKEKGVEHFKTGRVNEAYSRFKKSIRIIIFTGKTVEGILPLYVAVCNNIALCHMKMNNHELGISVCSKVLEHDDRNVKALLRRSSCYNMVKDFEKAYSDLIKVLQIEPKNPKAQEMMTPLKASLNDMNRRYVDMVKKMFK